MGAAIVLSPQLDQAHQVPGGLRPTGLCPTVSDGLSTDFWVRITFSLGLNKGPKCISIYSIANTDVGEILVGDDPVTGHHQGYEEI